MEQKTDFIINSLPYSISFTCPYCDSDVEILWEDVDDPDYWGDDWGVIMCPDCEEYVWLGDYEYV